MHEEGPPCLKCHGSPIKKKKTKVAKIHKLLFNYVPFILNSKYWVCFSSQENVALNKKGQNQIHSGPINEWSVEHVCHWLAANDFEKYSAAFREKNLTGSQLLLLDSSKMKALGISTSKDRDTLKKKIKEVKVNAEREKKLQEKERKLKEKEQKRMSKKK